MATRLQIIKPSGTVAVAQRARELRAQGIDVLSFSVGEPDFATPPHICAAAQASMERGETKYTSVGGIAELRAAIAADCARRRGGFVYAPDQIVVSVGAKHALFNLSLALYEEGDEVIIPAPYWVSYPEQVRLAGATPVIVQTTAEENFCLSAAKLRAALTPRTKALVLCTPSNPTGAAYSPAALTALAEVAAQQRFWIIVDEIYAHLIYDGFEQRSLLEIAPHLRDRIVLVDGVSKAYAMTGWRIGWTLAPRHVAQACEMLQGQNTTSPNSMAQYAAVAALEGPQDSVAMMRDAFAARRRQMVDGLRAIDGLACRMPEGAFYVFCDVRGLLGRRHGDQVLVDDMAVTRFLLEQARCAVVPGSEFGAPGYVRLSYAVSSSTIATGVERIAAAVASLKSA